jgi:Tfp pilus assembly protein PilO
MLLLIAVQTITNNRAYHSRINALNREITMLETRQKEIESKKMVLNITDEKLSLILAGLMKAGKKANLMLGEISIAEEKEREGYRVLPVTVVIKGNYNQIGRFINILEREEQRLQFQAIDLSTRETSGTAIIAKLKADFINL